MGAAGQSIRVWDRRAGREVRERIYGERGLRWVYETRLGRLASRLLSGPGLSTLMGAYYDSRRSARGIAPFVRAFDVPMHEFVEEPWESFNQFFARRFRRGARPFESEPDRLPAFAEGRYLAWTRVVPEQEVPVKGARVRARAVLTRPDDPDSSRWAARFEGGPLLLARLCPVDYHRYHYPADGITRAAWRIAGPLHSVHPIALRARGDILSTNERRVAILETERFGWLACVEVGAMGVGRIVQTHNEGTRFARGDEKGLFRFGASSVLLFGEPGRWAPDDDLVERTGRGVETLVRLGEGVARAT